MFYQIFNQSLISVISSALRCITGTKVWTTLFHNESLNCRSVNRGRRLKVKFPLCVCFSLLLSTYESVGSLQSVRAPPTGQYGIFLLHVVGQWFWSKPVDQLPCTVSCVLYTPTHINMFINNFIST